MEICFKIKEYNKYEDIEKIDFCIFSIFKIRGKGRNIFKYDYNN